MKKVRKKPSYLELHNRSGINVGDYVKVLRTAKDCEKGWGTHWMRQMNGAVGEILIVKEDGLESGFYLRTETGDEDYSNWYYPCFVLEKV